MTNKSKGIYLALLTTVVSGFSIFYNKIAVSNIDPLIFTTVKNGLAAIFLTSILIIRKSPIKASLQLKNKDWLKLFIIGLIGGSIPFALFFIGLSHIPAINANLIQKTLFLWVAILAIPLLGEKLTAPQMLGFLLIFISNFFIGGFKNFTASIYEIMIMMATVLWAIENIIAKKTLKDLSPSIVAWGRMFFGVIILMFIVFFQGKTHRIFQLSLAQISVGVISSLLLTAYVLSWYSALSKAPAILVTVILTLATIVTNLLTVFFINHGKFLFDFSSTVLLFGFFIAFVLPRFYKLRVRQ